MNIGKVSQINSVTPTNAVSSITNRTKNIQNQIMSKEQNLNRLSTDSQLSMEEKAKKRQELQKEIAELNRKLELMRAEQEEAEKKAEMKKEQEELLKEESLEKTSDSKASGDPSKTEKDKTKQEDLSIQDVQKMLSTNMTLRNDLIENSANYDKENTVRVLKAEIKLDELHGADTKSKKEELSELREKENFWIQAKYEQNEEATRRAVQMSITG